MYRRFTTLTLEGLLAARDGSSVLRANCQATDIDVTEGSGLFLVLDLFSPSITLIESKRRHK